MLFSIVHCIVIEAAVGLLLRALLERPLHRLLPLPTPTFERLKVGFELFIPDEELDPLIGQINVYGSVNRPLNNTNFLDDACCLGLFFRHIYCWAYINRHVKLKENDTLHMWLAFTHMIRTGSKRLAFRLEHMRYTISVGQYKIRKAHWWRVRDYNGRYIFRPPF